MWSGWYHHGDATKPIASQIADQHNKPPILAYCRETHCQTINENVWYSANVSHIIMWDLRTRLHQTLMVFNTDNVLHETGIIYLPLNSSVYDACTHQFSRSIEKPNWMARTSSYKSYRRLNMYRTKSYYNSRCNSFQIQMMLLNHWFTWIRLNIPNHLLQVAIK